MSLIVKDITKRFTGFAALDGVSFEAASGEFIALLGPSGSGKTTLLRLLAGLERPDAGSITFEGADSLALKPRDRRIGMVFQSYALFRHMTVTQNIAFGLDVRPASERPAKREIAATVERLMALVQLEGYGKRYPSQLSGGQRQRVALARALAISPRLLLLDEPFGALDALVRKDLRRQLKRIHAETGITTVFVTHDQEEALDLADRVVVLKSGKVEQIDTPQNLYGRPSSAFVFDFLGSANRAPCQVEGGVASFDGFSVPAITALGVRGQQVARFRPYEVTLSHDGPGWPVEVTTLLSAGSNLRLELRAPDGTVFDTQHAHGTPADSIRKGDTVRLRPERVFVYDGV